MIHIQGATILSVLFVVQTIGDDNAKPILLTFVALLLPAHMLLLQRTLLYFAVVAIVLATVIIVVVMQFLLIVIYLHFRYHRRQYALGEHYNSVAPMLPSDDPPADAE